MREYKARIHGLDVWIDKAGGGTVGREYDGSWFATVMNGPVYVLDEDVIVTGSPRTHAQVAVIAADFASEEI
jgi:hypothetical protein